MSLDKFDKCCGFQEGVSTLRNRFGFVKPQNNSFKIAGETFLLYFRRTYRYILLS